MEIAACVVLVNTRVVVHHVQASMGTFTLLRLLSKHMRRFLEVLLLADEFIAEPLSDSVHVNKYSKVGVTVCLVSVKCSRAVAREACEKVHKRFTELFRPYALASHRSDRVVGKPHENESVYEEEDVSLSPADIERILASSAEHLVLHGDNISALLNNTQVNKPRSLVAAASANDEKADASKLKIKLRDTFWSEETQGPSIRLADVQLYFGMILSCCINTFNTNHGRGDPSSKDLLLSDLMTAYENKGELHVRDVLIPQAVSYLLLFSDTSREPGIKTSKAVDRELNDAASRDRQINKMLILGLEGSGKRTLMKQMVNIYGKGFDEQERREYTSAVYSSFIKDLAAIEEQLEPFPNLRGPIVRFQSLVKLLETSYGCFLGSQWCAKLKQVIQMWLNSGLFDAIQKVLETPTFKITKPSANLKSFWLRQVAAMVHPDYVPTETDVIHVQPHGSGIYEYEFEIDGNVFRFVIPEQANERKKWIHQFENVTCVLYLSDMSTFDQQLPSDDTRTIFTESLEVFDQIVNSRWFSQVSTVLFLTGRDVLQAQLAQDPNAFSRHFPDQKSCAGYETVVQSIQDMFYEQNRNPDKAVYTHLTCVTDKSNIAAVMNAVKDITIRQSLSQCGLCGGGGGGGGFSYASHSVSPPAASASSWNSKSDTSSVVIPKGEKKNASSQSESRNKKKSKKDKVDNVFADMENVFNGMAEMVLWFETSPQIEHTHTPCLCFYNWDRNEAIRWLCVTLPLLLVLYVCLSAFAVCVLLPCVFWLLIVKTTKVERKVETGFAVRQEVLAKETWRQKACRVVTLVNRSIPMTCVLVVWPLVIVLSILPSNPDLAQPLIGSQLAFIALLQCLGCVRSMTAWLQANREKQQLASSAHLNALQTKAAQVERSLSKMTSFSAVSPSSKALFLSSSYMSAQGVSDAPVEDTQASVSLSVSPSAAKSAQTPSPLSATEENLDTPVLALSRPGTWIALISLAVEALQLACVALQGNVSSLTSVLLIQPVDFVPSEFRMSVQAGSSLVACFCVLALVLLFCMQLIKEVRIFGKLKQQGKQQEANKFFFHSFVGTILYGHGDMKGVSCLVSLSAALLSDSLFLIICTNLLRAVTCIEGTVCWRGSHSSLAAVSLVALSFYVPLCAMIGPLLSEARDGPARPGEIRTAQPFLSVVTISKFVLLLLVQYFFLADGSASPIASLVVCALMFGGMIAWTIRSGSLLIVSSFRSVDGVLLPVSPPVVSIWRTLSFAAGVWGGVVAVVFSFLRQVEAVNDDTSLVVLLVGLAVLLVVGLVWRRAWVRRELEIRRSMIALTLLLQGSEEIDVDIFYRAQLGDARMGERVQKKDPKLPRLKSTRTLTAIAPTSSQKNVTQLPPPITGIEVDAITSNWSVVTL